MKRPLFIGLYLGTTLCGALSLITLYFTLLFSTFIYYLGPARAPSPSLDFKFQVFMQCLLVIAGLALLVWQGLAFVVSRARGQHVGKPWLGLAGVFLPSFLSIGALIGLDFGTMDPWSLAGAGLAALAILVGQVSVIAMGWAEKPTVGVLPAAENSAGE